MGLKNWITDIAINVLTSQKFTQWVDARIAAAEASIMVRLDELADEIPDRVGQSVDKAGDAIRADIAAFISTDLPKIPGQIIAGVVQGIPNILNPFRGH